MDKKLLVKRAPSYYHNPELGLLQPIAYIGFPKVLWI